MITLNDGVDSIGTRQLQSGKYKQQNKHMKIVHSMVYWERCVLHDPSVIVSALDLMMDSLAKQGELTGHINVTYNYIAIYHSPNNSVHPIIIIMKGHVNHIII